MSERKTGLVFFPAFDWSISPDHPEREERLLYTRDQIFEEGLLDLPQITEYKSRLATVKDIARAHIGIPSLQEQITQAHQVASGAGLVLADALMKREITNGFALVRPPGHHAMRVVHGNRGFCNINNEAILVEYLRHKYGVKRLAIVDTDVHHGDGTQDIYYHDPDVLFISFHQDGRTLYPGTGMTYEMGGPRAYGLTVNIPLPPGTGDEGLHYVLDHLILPILQDFQPELVINSAGQDNHYTDPLANMKVTAQGYARMTTKLKPDLAVLEGGYAVETALPYVNMGILLALAGLDYSNLIEPGFDPKKVAQKPDVSDFIQRLADNLYNTWRKREQLATRQLEPGAQVWTRSKSVFYDTSYIREEQEEQVRICPNCPGYLQVDTAARHSGGHRYRGKAIFIPINACDSCHTEAYHQYQVEKRRCQADFIYLQDNLSNMHISYNCDTGFEGPV